MTKLAIILAGALTLSACATATPYQPAGLPGAVASGGYSDQRLEVDRFRVTFAGNSLTSRETVESFLLYRAAELTLSQGYDWFRTVDRRTDRSTRYYADPDPFYRSGFGLSYGFGWRPSWRYYGAAYGWRHWDPFYGDPFWADRTDIREINRYEASAEIVMGRGPKPAGDLHVLDARQITANLGPRITRPQ